MKKLILILAVSISLFNCKKKEEVKPQITTSTQKQSTPAVSNCNKDSSWTRSHPKTTSLYYFKENCTHITITFKTQTVTVLKPRGITNADIVSNYKSFTAFEADPNPNKLYYSIRWAGPLNFIIYDVSGAGGIGVGGPGMKMP